MCTPFSCTSIVRDSDSDEIFPWHKNLEPVFLNVYDMYKMNDFTSSLGIGAFHSGVQIYGLEYAYGGHQFPFTGVFTTTPRDTRLLASYFHLGDRFRFRQSIKIGYCNLNEREVIRWKNKLGRKFRGDRYHLLYNNCNHFSSTFTKILCQKDIPKWVNRLAQISARLPFVEKCLPIEWVKPVPIKSEFKTIIKCETRH